MSDSSQESPSTNILVNHLFSEAKKMGGDTTHVQLARKKLDFFSFANTALV